MLGLQYVEFALACGSMYERGAASREMQNVVSACADAFASAGGSTCGGSGGTSAFAELVAAWRRGELGDVGAAVGRVVGGDSSGGAVGCGANGGVGDEGSERGCGGVVEAVETECAPGLGVGSRGKHFEKNRKKRIASKLARLSAKRKGDGAGCVSSESETGTVRTVDTRTGIEVEAAQTLAARRVAENKRAEVEAKVAAALAEHKLKALSDKGRTAVVERLAAARYEQRINEARLRAQKSFSASEDSLKSLGSMGSAGELYARQAIKKSRDDAKTLKYVQDQANYLLERASPEDRQAVAEMPAPVYDDEFEVFGDCPSDFDEEQREAYYADLNRANFEHGQVRVESEGHREATPEELLRIKEELAALSVY